MSTGKFIAASRLKPHPLLKETGMMSRLVAREAALAKKGGDKKALHLEKLETLEGHLAALHQDIRENGIRKPLEICPAGDKKMSYFILDGRHRWEAALEVGLEKVPCVIVDPATAQNVILSAALTKPMSKGATAYLALLIHPEVAVSEYGGDRKSRSRSDLALTIFSLAAKVGVSKGLMVEASKLYNFFHKTGKRDADGNPMFVPGSKKKFEDAIFSPGGSLRATIGSVLAFRDGVDTEAKSKSPQGRWDDIKVRTKKRLKDFAEHTEGHFQKANEEARAELVKICAAGMLSRCPGLATAMASEIMERLDD